MPRPYPDSTGERRLLAESYQHLQNLLYDFTEKFPMISLPYNGAITLSESPKDPLSPIHVLESFSGSEVNAAQYFFGLLYLFSQTLAKIDAAAQSYHSDRRYALDPQARILNERIVDFIEKSGGFFLGLDREKQEMVLDLIITYKNFCQMTEDLGKGIGMQSVAVSCLQEIQRSAVETVDWLNHSMIKTMRRHLGRRPSPESPSTSSSEGEIATATIPTAPAPSTTTVSDERPPASMSRPSSNPLTFFCSYVALKVSEVTAPLRGLFDLQSIAGEIHRIDGDQSLRK